MLDSDLEIIRRRGFKSTLSICMDLRSVDLPVTVMAMLPAVNRRRRREVLAAEVKLHVVAPSFAARIT